MSGLRHRHINQMRAHVDEGGVLTHRNAVELLVEVERLQDLDQAWLDAEAEIEQLRSEVARERTFKESYLKSLDKVLQDVAHHQI